MDRDEKVENEFETRSIIPAWLKKKWLIIVIALAAVLVLATISFTVRYLDNPIMKIPGTYVFDDQKIIFTEDGMCEVNEEGYKMIHLEKGTVEYQLPPDWCAEPWQGCIFVQFRAQRWCAFPDHGWRC